MGEKQEIIKFNSQNGEVELNADFQNDTIWATREQIAQLFDVDRTGINRHIRNIYKSGELKEKATYAKIAQVQNEGKRRVKRDIDYFNLDMILSVGYRVNSAKATEFRKWANKILKDYLVKGLAVNEKRLEQLNFVLNVLERSSVPEISGVSNLISQYTEALFLLENYDAHSLPDVEGTQDSWRLTYSEAREFLNQIKASDLFAKERTSQFKGILDQIYSGFGDVEYYPSVEEKAANLLYFIVKDHPFYDGNKRSAAALFVYFLYKNHALRNINNNALAAIVLMVALSNPDERENMVLLIRNFLDDTDSK